MPTVPRPGPETPDEPGRLFLAAAYLVLFLGGIILGLFGALLLPYSVGSAVSAASPTGGGEGAAHILAAGQGSATQVLSAGLLFALIANPLLSWAGLRMAGTRLAAFTPLAGWLLAVLPLATSRATGSVVLPSGARSFAFLIIGALTFTMAGALGKPSRGMSVLLGQPLSSTPTPPPPPPTAAVRKAAPPRTASKRRKRR